MRDPAVRMAEAIGVALVEVSVNPFNYLVLVESADLVRSLSPDMAAIGRMDRSGVIVTAPGDGL